MMPDAGPRLPAMRVGKDGRPSVSVAAVLITGTLEQAPVTAQS